MKRFLLAAMSVALVACSSNDDIEQMPAELVDFDSRIELDVLWSDNVGAGADGRYMLLTPAVFGDRVYATDSEGQVTAYNRQDGDDLWEAELDLPVSGGVGAGAEQVLVGTYTGKVVALSTVDGSELWSAQLSSEVLSAPQTNGQVVVVQASDGNLFGLNAEDGKQLWLYDNAIPALTLRGTAHPLLVESVVYAGFASGKILALNAADGTLMWEQRVGVAEGRSELERVVDVDGAPILVDDILYSASYQGRLVALNRSTGRGVWSVEESTHTDLAAGNGRIYLVNADGYVRAYGATSGELEWENDQLLRRRLGAPQTFGGYLAVGDFEGYLHILDQSTGEFVARRKVDSEGLRAPMQSVDGVLFVQGNGADLEAIVVE